MAVRTARVVERLGVHVLPSHFYSPVPDRRWLQAHPEAWRRPLSLTGIELDPAAQLQWLRTRCHDHLDEVAGFSFLPGLANRGIPFRYGLVEAQVLHCVVRSTAPRRILEIGSGASTALMSDALAANAADGGPEGTLTAYDPHAAGSVGLLPHTTVHRLPGQLVPAAAFDELQAGDLLFIDSTHVVRTGSELAPLYLEMLPRLRPGVLVHIHDIFLPFAYSPWILDDLWDWQETSLVAALLSGNPRFRVRACLSALHSQASAPLRQVLPDYVPLELRDGIAARGSQGHYPSSLWLATTGEDTGDDS